MYYFIVNLTSRTGKAKAIWMEVERELQHRNIPYEAFITEYVDHARELADMLCTKGMEYRAEHGPDTQVCIVVVGGDGTVNEVVNGMHHFDEIRFGYIATGSGNDLGRGLKISKDPLEALEGILNATDVFPMDLGKVTYGHNVSRYFIISSGIGIDADVCKMALTSKLKKFLNNLGLGSLTYVLLTLKALFTMPTTEVEAVFDSGETEKIPRMIFMAGMNHPYEGGGVPMAPRADCQDGKISVCCVYNLNKWQGFIRLPWLVLGKHEGIRGIRIIECESYELHLKNPMVLHCDGEYLGEQTVIKYVCEKGRLQVLK